MGRLGNELPRIEIDLSPLGFQDVESQGKLQCNTESSACMYMYIYINIYNYVHAHAYQHVPAYIYMHICIEYPQIIVWCVTDHFSNPTSQKATHKDTNACWIINAGC